MSTAVRLSAAAAAAALLALSSAIPGAAAGDSTPVDLDELAAGEPPRVPYVDGGPDGVPRIVDGTTVVPLGADRVTGFVETSEGYLVRTEPADDGRHRLTVFGSTDDRVVAEGRLSGPVANADGTRVAWARHHTDAYGNPLSTRIVLADAEGRRLATLPVEGDAVPIGFLDGDLVVDSQLGDIAPSVWSPSTGEVERVPGADAVTATNGASVLATVNWTDHGDPACSRVRVAVTYESLWRSCELRVTGLSDDGQRAVAVDARSDGLGPSGYTTVDLTTGDSLGKVAFDLSQRAVWEDTEALLFDVWDDGKQALVRCTGAGAGACELATPVVPAGDPVESRAPFLLAN